MKKHNRYLLYIVTDISKIHDHLVKEDKFSAGFELGALLNRIVNHINDDEREDEEVQEEESDEEREESSEEEDSNQASYFTEYLEEKRMREMAEKSISDFMDKLKKMESDNDSIKATKRAIFDLQDLLMRLIKFDKINEVEVPYVLNTLINTGVAKGDIDVICNLKNRQKDGVAETN